MATDLFQFLKRSLERLMYSILPDKAEFMKKLDQTQATDKEKNRISVVYDFSLLHHMNAPKRATGEPYFWHIHRAVMRLLFLFVLIGIWDEKTLLILLLHDVIEDAKKAGFDPELVHRNIVHKFGTEIAYGTMAITKRKGEHSHDVLRRLTKEPYWRSLVAKLPDREDNLITLYGMSLESQLHKLHETEKYFPAILNRLEAEIRIRILCGALPKKWSWLVPIFRRDLANLAAENRRRLLLKP